MTVSFEPPKDSKAIWADAQKAITFPIGATSPLWFMFAGAASAGVAYWWLNRWRTATNLEAALAPPLEAATLEAVSTAPELTAPTPAVVEAFEAVGDRVVEAAPEVLAEAKPEDVVEAMAEPVLETLPEPAIEAAPEILAEAAPEPILAVAPTPKPAAKAKPKTKAAAVRAAPRTTSGPTRRS